jgi:hypothetical protein
MEKENIVKAIICGYERGGTTLVNKLLLSHTDLCSGFESGFLLADTPAKYLDRKFSDYNGSLIKNGWGINDRDLAYICESNNWNQGYDRLRERSHVINDKSAFLFDKTPRYMRVLNDVLCRYQLAPCVVVLRRPEAVICSWLKRKEDVDINDPGWILLRRFCRRYNDYARGYAEALKYHPYRILTIQYEELCNSPQQALNKILAHIGYEGDTDLRAFEEEYGVRGGDVTNEYVDEYKNILSKKIIKTIRRLTQKGVKNLGLQSF